MIDILTITGINVPPYSTRAATQTLQPIDAATQVGRTVNGDLIDLSDPDNLFRVFASTITGQDTQAPEFAWPGIEVTVHCIARLWFKTVGGVQIRDEVPDSMIVDGDYTSYCPILICRVLTWQDNRNDWAASHEWQLTMEEVGDPGGIT